VTEVATVLYRRDEIRRRVDELAEAITRDYTGKEPVLVSVLKGGTIFLADLFRLIDLPVRVDFMSISSYGDREEESGVVRVLKDLDHDIGGEHVLVVEDIIDTGLTLSYLLTALRAREPTSIEVCTLLDRSVRRIAPLDIRYRGFDCPDRFVVGYGLDHEERFRNLPMILAVSSPSVLDEHPDALLPFLERAAAVGPQELGPGGPGVIAAPGQKRSPEHR
jgi:hypoxanthine phosphoribosyltransferase